MFRKCVTAFFIFISVCAVSGQGFIIDHTCTDVSLIPEEYIQLSKNALRVGYGHTSHGSQLMTGIHAFRGDPGDLFYFEYTGWGLNPGVFINDYWGNAGGASDLGHNGDTAWRDATVTMLNHDDNDRNVVIWSWCGGVSDNTSTGIDAYLNAMNTLEGQYPDVTFVYMTGHLDGSGFEGNLHQMNERIRQYCRANGKVLFDFADIESYDPDGTTNFNQLYATDGCDYDTNGDGNPWGDGNWASEWLAQNPASELADVSAQCDSCAHSMQLNCVLKGRAFWWMMARLAGWNGDDEDPEDPEDKSITLTFPYSGEVLSPGWNYSISWQTTGDIDRVNILCSAAGSDTWTSVVTGTENDGSYSWKAPFSPSSSWRIKIEDSDNSVSDTSGCFAVRRYSGDDSIYIPAFSDREVMLDSSASEEEIEFETFVTNMTDNPVTFSMRFLDSNGAARGERTVSLQAWGKQKLDTDWSMAHSETYIHCDLREGLSYFTRFVDEDTAFSAYLNQYVSDELTIVHIAEETHYWNTFLYYTNTDRVDTLISSCDSDYLCDPMFSCTLDLEQYFDSAMVDEQTAWGTLSEDTYFTPENSDIFSGFELFVTESGDGGSVELLSEPSDTLYIPHIPEETDIFWTGLAFLNRTEESQTLSVTFYTDAGETVGEHFLEIQAGEKVKGTVDSLFPESLENGRWAVVECSGSGVFGIEMYGTLNAGICGFSLSDSLSDDCILPLMLTGEGQWTGLALANPHQSTNEVDIVLINGNGSELGTEHITMNPMSRFKSTVQELFSEAELSDNCYIRIHSEYPVTGVSAAGNMEFKTMHALTMRDVLSE